MVTDLKDVYGVAGLSFLVTGATTGLGRPTARRMAAAGAFVIAARRSGRCEALVEEIEAYGGAARAIRLDVADEASVMETFGEVAKQPGRLDVLVNAGTMAGGDLMTETSAAQWDAMHDVNLRGAFLCAREAVRVMQRQDNGGSIVNISTIGSLRPVLPGNEVYGPSKAGLNMQHRLRLCAGRHPRKRHPARRDSDRRAADAGLRTGERSRKGQNPFSVRHGADSDRSRQVIPK